jgi:hypothetical protein
MRLARFLWPLLGLLLVPAVAFGADDGVIGPQLGLVASGRHLQPAGTLVDLGNFPTGGAVTPDGRFYWTISTGRGQNDIRIVPAPPAASRWTRLGLSPMSRGSPTRTRAMPTSSSPASQGARAM